MSDFDSGNSVNCVLLDVNLYETKREKSLVPLYHKLVSDWVEMLQHRITELNLLD